MRQALSQLAAHTADISFLKSVIDATVRKSEIDREEGEGLLSTFQQEARHTIGEILERLGGAENFADYLAGRVEFVRRELLFELQYGGNQTRGPASKLLAPTEVVNPQCLNAGIPIRLNLGCGHVPLAGFINVDRRRLPGVDIVAEVDNLPFLAGKVHSIHSAHLLEHFPQELLRRQLLPYWISLLVPGGEFSATVPDAVAMIENYSENKFTYDALRLVTFGGQDYDGDFHFNMFSIPQVRDLIEDVGLEKFDLVYSAQRNGDCYEFKFTARKPLLTMT